MADSHDDFPPRTEPVWLAVLQGDEAVFAHLASQLTTDELCLSTLSGRRVAYASSLQRYEYSSKFHDAALSDLIPLLGALAHWVEPNFAGFQLENVIRLYPDGRHSTIVHASMDVVESPDSSATNLVSGETFANRLARVAWADPTVLRVIRFRESPDRNLWTGLYRVVEAIKEDSGGKVPIDAEGWPSQNWVNLFRRTANSEAAGPWGRHGERRKDPPPNPMTIAEARRGVRRIFSRWIDHKVAQH